MPNPSIFAIALIFLLLILIITMLKTGVPCAIYVPTPMKVVRRMLKLASLKPGEILYDLGCGDGRILVTAAKEYGARAVGIEVNPLLIWLAKRRMRRSGLEGKIEVLRGNLFDVDLSRADVVTIYLSQYANNRLKHKLARELKDGARVVSYIFPIEGWRPYFKDEDYEIYVYKAPFS